MPMYHDMGKIWRVTLYMDSTLPILHIALPKQKDGIGPICFEPYLFSQ